MIGLGKMVMANNAPQSEFGCFITPSTFTVKTSNGAYTTPFFYANVTGGVGPFTYEWTVDNSQFTISQPTSERTAPTVSGYNVERFTVLTLKVTDASNSSVASSVADISVLFGTIP